MPLTFAQILSALGRIKHTPARDVHDLLADLLTPDVGAATAVAGAATLHGRTGKVTSESLTTAQNAIYTLTVTSNQIAPGDIVLASVANGSNTQGTPMIGLVTPGDGTVAVQVINKHATSEAFNGTVVVSFTALKAAA